MAILILLAVHLAAFFIPILAKILIHLDYAFVLLATWIFVFGAGGHFEHGLLLNLEVHTVFVILIYLAAIGLWYIVQNIRFFRIYIFRVIACAFSALVLTFLVSDGLLGEDISNRMDVIWQWTFGIVYFAIAVGLRAKSSSLIREETEN